MTFNQKVQEALRHINSLYPTVSQVFFTTQGSWLYCDESFEAPEFDNSKVDILLLADAADAAHQDKGFPCGYYLYDLADYYALWDSLADVAVGTGDAGDVAEGAIAQQFLHFPIGTPCEDIWRWFERQHPDFVVGEVMQGIRKAEWHISMTLEDGQSLGWSGFADDAKHAEGLAIAHATSNGMQVYEVTTVTEL